MVLMGIITFLAGLVPQMLTAGALAAVTTGSTRATNALLDAIFPKFQESGKEQVLQPFIQCNPTATDEQALQNGLATEMNKDPSFIDQVATAVTVQKNEILSWQRHNKPDPRLASLLARMQESMQEMSDRWGSYLQERYGLSDAQAKVEKEKGGLGLTIPCPIGGENMYQWELRYTQSNETLTTPFPSYSTMLPSAVAECPSGLHRWYVFANPNADPVWGNITLPRG